jgi:7-cyano-7-deazaguanine synthase
MEGMKNKAVVLLSGGIDSTTTLAIALDEGFRCYALSFRYGQRHSKEVDSAKKIALHYHIEHKIMKINLDEIGGSALTDKKIRVPKNRDMEKMGKGIPITYVPARNTIMLSYALAYAEVIGAKAIFIGANAIDYSGYPDCRPKYFKAFQKMADVGTKKGVEGSQIKIKIPLINMKKSEIIKKGISLSVPYNLSWSCYLGGSVACGQCDSCLLRLKGFAEAGCKDPIRYKN